MKQLRNLAVLLVVCLGCFSAARACASDASLTLSVAKEAQDCYDRGLALRRTDPGASLKSFQESAKLWDRIRRAGAENGPLEYNLGNAWMESGETGRAIAAYLRAERFMPGNADLERNLALARSTVSSSFERTGGVLLIDSVARWWHIVPRSLRLTLAWATWFLFWILLAVRLFTASPAPASTRSSVWRPILVSLLAGWLIFGGTIVADEAIHRWRPRAVLTESGITLRKGNAEGFEPAFLETLGAGVECTVIEERPDWLRIELPDGRSGWIRASQAEVT